MEVLTCSCVLSEPDDFLVSARTFNALLKEVRACELCAKCLPLGPRPVLQCHPSAQILIIGQAPSRKVHESGVPFQDVSGDRLRSWLGISTEDFYDAHKVAIVPMGFCYPGTGATGDLPPRPECAAAWHQKILGHLQNIQLTLIIGQYAQAYYFRHEKMSVTEAVQSWRDRWPAFVALPHPSPRNNRWIRRNPWFEADLLPMLRARISEILATDVSLDARGSRRDR